VVVAALAAWHDRHVDAARAIADVKVLPAHVLLEAYSVLTRLPGGLAVLPATAAKVIQTRFPGPPLRLTARDHQRLLTVLSTSQIAGGSVYDGLVALEALAGDARLLTLDERAQQTYWRVGLTVETL
jgi:PIN domain